jgi:hypothetical protein
MHSMPCALCAHTRTARVCAGQTKPKLRQACSDRRVVCAGTRQDVWHHLVLASSQASVSEPTTAAMVVQVAARPSSTARIPQTDIAANFQPPAFTSMMIPPLCSAQTTTPEGLGPGYWQCICTSTARVFVLAARREARARRTSAFLRTATPSVPRSTMGVTAGMATAAAAQLQPPPPRLSVWKSRVLGQRKGSLASVSISATSRGTTAALWATSV